MSRSATLSSRLPFVVVALVHLGGCLWYFPPSEIFSGDPLMSSDYVFHFLEGRRVAALLHEGSFWGYSTAWAAGAPAGFLGMVNSKPWALVLAAVPSGLQPLAFNLAVLLAMWSFPVLVHAAARALGYDRREAAAAMGLAAAVWYGSALFRIFWRGGSVLFVVASGVALWVVARLYRAWSEPDRRQGWGSLYAVVALLPWIHPVALVPVAVGGLAIWLVTFTRAGWRLGRIAVLGAAALLPSLPWLVPFVRYAGLRRGYDYATLEGGPSYLVHDLVSGALHVTPWNRAEVAILTPLVLATWLGLDRLRREPGLLASLLLTQLGLAGLAYGGARALGLGVLQPHRFVIPLAALAAITAAPAFARWRAQRSIPTVLLVVITILVADRLRVGMRASDALASGLAQSDRAALDLLRAHAADAAGKVTARVLLEGAYLGEDLPGRPRARRVTYSFVALEDRLDAEWLGAPIMTTGLPEDHASFWYGRLFGRLLSGFTAEQLLAECELYDVGWIVTATAATRSRLEAFRPAFAWVAGDGPIALFRVARAPSRATHGRAESPDRRSIRFESSDGAPAVLKYHWIPGLTAAPGAELSPHAADPDSPARFIAIDPPAPGIYEIGDGG